MNEESQRQPRAPIRIFIAAPVLVLTLGALALLVMSPLAWGAASQVEISDWVIPSCGLTVSLPALAIGLGTTRLVLHYTRRPFQVDKSHFSLVIFLPPAAIALVFLAAGIADSSSYDHFRNDEGEVTVSDYSLILITVVASAIANLGLWACAYFYATAFEQPKRERRPPDVDRVAGLLDNR